MHWGNNNPCDNKGELEGVKTRASVAVWGVKTRAVAVKKGVKTRVADNKWSYSKKKLPEADAHERITVCTAFFDELV